MEFNLSLRLTLTGVGRKTFQIGIELHPTITTFQTSPWFPYTVPRILGHHLIAWPMVVRAMFDWLDAWNL